jgi:hypothetical protein
MRLFDKNKLWLNRTVMMRCSSDIRKLQVADGVKSATAFRDQFTATFTQTVLAAIYTPEAVLPDG